MKMTEENATWQSARRGLEDPPSLALALLCSGLSAPPTTPVLFFPGSPSTAVQKFTCVCVCVRVLTPTGTHPCTHTHTHSQMLPSPWEAHVSDTTSHISLFLEMLPLTFSCRISTSPPPKESHELLWPDGVCVFNPFSSMKFFSLNLTFFFF